MKGLYKSFLILSCASLFSTAFAESNRYFSFSKASNETALAESFNDFKSGCMKTILGLYMVYKYIDEGEMDRGCNPVNRFGRYLDSEYTCDDEEYNRRYIEPALRQRYYLCSEKPGEGHDYCDPDLVNTDVELTESKIRDKYCSSSVGWMCKDDYMRFTESVEEAFKNSTEDSFSDFICIYEKTNLYYSIKRIDDEIIGYAGKHCVEKPTTNVTTTMASTTAQTSTPTVSTNGRCGKDDGICPSGECCSKYKYCGRSSAHCDVSKGCQSEFGKCNNDSTTTIASTTKASEPTVSKNGKCGKKDGICPSGECCSKYGYCGRSSDHCKKSRGCQSEFGECKDNTTTKKTTKTTKKTTKTTKKSTSTLKVRSDGKCGKNVGICKSGYCCSKYGYCGKTDKHCKSGCQSEFGTCN